MQNYINGLTYKDVSLDKSNFSEVSVPGYPRFKMNECHPAYLDASSDFTHEKYQYPYLPLYLGEHSAQVDDVELNVLRLMIRKNDRSASVFLPNEYRSLQNLILESINYHRQFFSVNADCFIYLTVRSSTYEDLYYRNSMEWHVDGFQGSRIARHIIEQDIFWCNKSPTQFLLQPMYCQGLDPSRHDINEFFHHRAEENRIVATKKESMYLVTPYNIHRTSPIAFEGKRVFVRINFSPVLIEDSTNSVNPYFEECVFQKRRDVRDFLGIYRTDERVDSGFEFF